MTCNQKSALTTVSTAVQTVTANGFVNFPTNNLLTGVSIKHPAGSTSVNLIQGLYLVTLNADVTPAAAGDMGLQLVRNGVAVPEFFKTASGSVREFLPTLRRLSLPFLLSLLGQHSPAPSIFLVCA